MHSSLRFLALLTMLVGPGNAATGRSDGTFRSNGVKIHYAVQGKGEPVVLLHGWLSSGTINWDLPGTTRQLSRDYRVIRLDFPGHGQSDKPTREGAYGPELVEDVVRLMDHLKIKKAHIVGYSMGGVIAANLVAKHPDRVRSVVLGGMGWLRQGSAEQALFAAGGNDGSPAGICFRSLAKLALTEKDIKAIRVPVTILFGDRDFLRHAYADPLKVVRKDWPIVEIRGANHLNCIFKPQFRDEIQKWLAKQR